MMPKTPVRRKIEPPPTWPADRIERWAIDRLIPYARNARVHTDAQIAQIAGSIREFGWTIPVLVDEAGTLIAGHGRVMAARQLGYDTIPTMVARGWSEAQRRAYTLADNQLATKSTWDLELLRNEVADLRELGVDLALAGFEAVELDQLFAADREAGADWDGMPEFEQGDQTAYQTVRVHLHDQAAVDAFAELLGQRITRDTKFVWYPREAEARYVDKAYVAERPKRRAHG